MSLPLDDGAMFGVLTIKPHEKDRIIYILLKEVAQTSWLGKLESNQHIQSQSLLCYHYTTSQYKWRTLKDLNLQPSGP